MIDLPPQVPYLTEQASSSTKFGAGHESVVEIDNETGYNVVVSTTGSYYPGCWIGGNNPSLSLNNKAIKTGNILRKTEQMNTAGCPTSYIYFAFPITLTFNTDSGIEKIGLTINQADIFTLGTSVNNTYTTYQVGNRDFTGNFRVIQTIDYPSFTNSFQIVSIQ